LCTGTSPAHAVVRKNIFRDLPQTSERCRSRMNTLNHMNMQSKQTFRVNRT